MRLDIHGLDLNVTPALTEHVHRQLQQALGRFAAQIQSFRVRVNDVNGPRGGNDKRCRMEACLERGGRVFAERVDADLYAAISSGGVTTRARGWAPNGMRPPRGATEETRLPISNRPRSSQQAWLQAQVGVERSCSVDTGRCIRPRAATAESGRHRQEVSCM